MKDKRNKEDIQNIIFLLNKMKRKVDESNVYSIHPGGTRYLLGQTLRQIVLPKSNVYISHKADVLWKKLRLDTKDEIFDYVWQMKVTNENPCSIEVETYKGASKSPERRILDKGDYFNFRQVFHDEHIVSMKMIIDKLVNLEEPNYENVMEILRNISICRMLKSEDRKINEKYKRPFSTKSVIEEIYLKYWIYLKDYDYPHQKAIKEDTFEDSIHLAIPKDVIIREFSSLDSHGGSFVELPNGMVTDVYKEDNGDIFSITNDKDLITYVKILQEAFAN